MHEKIFPCRHRCRGTEVLEGIIAELSLLKSLYKTKTGRNAEEDILSARPKNRFRAQNADYLALLTETVKVLENHIMEIEVCNYNGIPLNGQVGYTIGKLDEYLKRLAETSKEIQQKP